MHEAPLQENAINNWPKTLIVRNTPGGMIWQIYHVKSAEEANVLANNASKNGFFGITLEQYQPSQEETFPDWREVSADYMPKAIAALTYRRF